jgi:hypothetical protein
MPCATSGTSATENSEDNESVLKRREDEKD